MVSDTDDFNISGPIHLTSVNWGCPHYQRSVVASLVQGVYVLERDRQEKREALAPPWWKSFHFELHRELIVDDDHSSIYGAIYEFKSQLYTNAPRFVVALRGTLWKSGSIFRDLKLDFKIIRNRLHLTPQLKSALMKEVESIVSACGGDGNVWLAGHSLGSAMAMLAGRNMAEKGTHLKSFLFNPPFNSFPPSRMIKRMRVKRRVRIVSSFITVVLAAAVKGNASEDNFVKLSAWVPDLFVNPGDHICSEYVDYFERRGRMEEKGLGSIERVATQNSKKALLMNAIGRESQTSHLIPSANLTVNMSPTSGCMQAHALLQWWTPDPKLEMKHYRWATQGIPPSSSTQEADRPLD